MKVIYKIAKAELSFLFCSPIAWLILIIFAFQSGMAFADNISRYISTQAANGYMGELTERIFASYPEGVLLQMQSNLYLYIPLLTMGLISKEKNTGSIKLLFSSPINNVQIVLGKFSAMMVYGLILVGILLIFVLFANFTIRDFDLAAILSALLGIYLLICAYAAIGLFMSTLTAYQVVAAVGTLAVLTILNFIQEVGTDIAFIRDLTYWLSIRGRSEEMLEGLLCSDAIAYFIIVIALFVTLSILKLNSERCRENKGITTARYLVVFAIAFALGQITSMPKLMGFYDATATKKCTLHPNSQTVMNNMDGGLTITTYVNLLDIWYKQGMPNNINKDKKNLRRFLRFKPETEMKYVYYYAHAYNPNLDYQFPDKNDKERAETMAELLDLDFDMFLTADEAQKICPINLEKEGYRFLRVIERENGQTSIIRTFGVAPHYSHPGEGEIIASMKNTTRPPVKVSFLSGHGERDINRVGDAGYYNFTQDISYNEALVNNGFVVEPFELNLKEGKHIPEDTGILYISQVKEPLSSEVLNEIKKYIAEGGNLLISGDPGCQDNMNPIMEELGVEFMPGRLMTNNPDISSNLILATPTVEATKLPQTRFAWMKHWDYRVPMVNAVGIDHSLAKEKGWETFTLMTTDSLGCWNEKTHIAFTDKKAELNPETGEKEECFTMILHMSRKVGEKEQRVVVMGDSDWCTNGEMGTYRQKVNSEPPITIRYNFSYLTQNEYPVYVEEAYGRDNKLFLGLGSVPWIKLFCMGILPLILTITCITIQVKRRRK